MTKIIAFYQQISPQWRSLLGQCDARCYRRGAEENPEPCDCICHGANHGVGFFQALANTRIHQNDWLQTAIASGQRVDSVFVHPQAQQLSLFETL